MDTGVIVVGAGPTGLMLAGELRLAGVEVVVLERLAEPTGQSRGLGFTARTMEVFDQRGLLPRFGEFHTSAAGHFGGLPLDFGVLDGIHFQANGIPQWRTEAVLSAWAEELGAEIRRGHELTAITDHGDHVEARFTGPGGAGSLRAAHLVGCDGGHSTVRALAGIAFPGSAATMEMFLADLKGAGLPPRPIGQRVPGGMAMNAPIGDGIDRIIVCERGTEPSERTGPPPFAEVAAAWQRLTGEDISGATPLWTSSFTDSARQAEEYRRGRVFLAGDAAHVHLPAGGQGLNVGIQDAVNLGWKLGAALRAGTPVDLLDTYHEERHPVGARVLMNTQAQGLIYLGGTEVDPLRTVLGELMAFDEVNRHLVGMVSGMEIRYGDAGESAHPLLGRRVPPVELVTGGRATDPVALLRDAKGVLLDLSGDDKLARLAAGWSDRVAFVPVAPARAGDGAGALAGADAVLVRPDGYVAWVAPGTVDAAAALEQWFGQPVR
ncbi:FAD-dependent monooxygenase [Streptomyces marincola]|uniref:Monooxygenase n=1 Tax=Streptomyces marincola TaxID=2878388 RepID=A0A1W7D5W8_9ACTN|nr:FAD-dependent monooxygenase [Streptomyces marincola]ARQ72309.1 monooxygenase [Streptomyces marincola]